MHTRAWACFTTISELLEIFPVACRVAIPRPNKTQSNVFRTVPRVSTRTLHYRFSIWVRRRTECQVIFTQWKVLERPRLSSGEEVRPQIRDE
ncbi:hypothetical protein NPIL_494191 [Nephila pilipes]|uniref:Secreted protein n=1 Tax=Nephila pilipes TaxID=299642 RepID=A0A8X6NWM3_NEPPI|nr:hypothetical protein NPIL_494191 [Nephila pilipes]